jgi:hypothetical protein
MTVTFPASAGAAITEAAIRAAAIRVNMTNSFSVRGSKRSRLRLALCQPCRRT